MNNVIKSRRMRWAENVVGIEKRRGLYRVLMGKPEGKRPLGRPRHRWEKNIKMGLSGSGMWVLWTESSWLRIGTGVGDL
jgi:hypothetical protein